MYLGIDIGSLSCEAVLINEDEQIIASSVVPTGAKNIESMSRSIEEVLKTAGICKEEIISIVSTGYGRNRVDGRHSSVTEITCHARGIRAILPDTRVLIDIGGQDSKAILIGNDGNVIDFIMNDKCAAGTGRFLEAMARALEVDITELAGLGNGAKGEVTISSMCTVFAESEVVSLIGQGKEINEIVYGLNQSIASRTKGLIKRVMPDLNGSMVAMSGGVARNSGVVKAIAESLGCKISVPEMPEIVGAFGAALIAKEKVSENNNLRDQLIAR